VSALPAAAALASRCFRADEPVFDGYPGQLPGIEVPVFGQSVQWSARCIRRPSNRARKDWKIRFTLGDPVWNLRAREVAFAILNPAHRALREAGIYKQQAPERIGTVVRAVSFLRELEGWALGEGMARDLGQWEDADWHAFLDYVRARHQADAAAGRRHIEAVRRLHELSAVLTDGGPRRDPWNRRPASKITGVAWDGTLRTAPIPPSTWWPLLHDAWIYIRDFAPDVLDLREQLAAQRPVTTRRAQRESGRQVHGPEENHRLVREWLADPRNQIPVHARAWQGAKPGEPMWVTLSLAVSGGRTGGLFGRSRPGPHALARRALVQQELQTGRALALRSGQGAGALGIARQQRPARRRSRDLDEQVQRWLCDPRRVIPVHDGGDARGQRGEPVWEAIERLATGRGAIRLFSAQGEAGRRRRRLVYAALAERGVQVLAAPADVRDYRYPCPGFTEVERGDGARGPWRAQISLRELDVELRMIRAAGYIFIAALTLMRDSEIQEIQRGAVTTYYGSPAIVSRKVKAQDAEPQLHWWVIEQVAEAITVLQRLSWHETHLFATLEPPMADTAARTRVQGRRGITAADDIDFFIEQVNANAQHTGLARIPAAHVRPHMFRRTMAVIAAQQPDGEIALGLQLKHAARRALANRTTQAYYAADSGWAAQFDTQYELAAATRLVEALRRRRSGEAVAFGPGAAGFHQRLDTVSAALEADPALHAQFGDDAVLAALLREQFPDLYWGTVNHCLWNPSVAQCQSPLPENERGQKPLLGACQPAKCRNSTITDAHMPVWLAEEDDLRTMLTQLRMAPPRRASLRSRLEEVGQITGAWRRARGKEES
jgi:hypothetical protein